MKIRIEMENGKNYKLNWQETKELFTQQVTYFEGNGFLPTDTGKYISIKKIIEWEVVEE